MGQGQMTADDCVDLVLTNALIVDHWDRESRYWRQERAGSLLSVKPGTRTSSPA